MTMTQPLSWLLSENNITVFVGQEGSGNKFSCTAGGNVKWCSHLGEVLRVPHKVTT